MENVKLKDFDVWYKPCANCGYDTAKSTSPKSGNKQCWKCGSMVYRDYSNRALKNNNKEKIVKGDRVKLINIKRLKNKTLRSYANCIGVVCSDIIEHNKSVLVEFENRSKLDQSFWPKWWVKVDRLEKIEDK